MRYGTGELVVAAPVIGCSSETSTTFGSDAGATPSGEPEPEDHAACHYWSDEFHNPEHRIETIGVLRRVVPA